jgi:hypothetical protein
MRLSEKRNGSDPLYLLGVSLGRLGSKLYLARRPLREHEDALIGAGGDGVLELVRVRAIHFDIKLLHDILRQSQLGREGKEVLEAHLLNHVA